MSARESTIRKIDRTHLRACDTMPSEKDLLDAVTNARSAFLNLARQMEVIAAFLKSKSRS